MKFQSLPAGVAVVVGEWETATHQLAGLQGGKCCAEFETGQSGAAGLLNRAPQTHNSDGARVYEFG